MDIAYFCGVMNTMNILLAFGTAWLIAMAFIPSLIRAATIRKMLDMPAPRKIHRYPVPLLGGVGITAATLIPLLFFGARHVSAEHVFILVGGLILFFVGLRDDISPLSPYEKLFGQFTAAAVVVWLGQVRIVSLHGLWGIGEWPAIVSIVFSILLLVFLINAINFMDGMDGLAASFSAAISLVAGLLAFNAGELFYALLAFTLAGALAGFLRYNFSPARIFMGDAGSMTVGYLVAILAFRMTSFQLAGQDTVGISLSIGLLTLPAVDALQLIITRWTNGQSPFRPDTRHIHHHLLRRGMTATRALLLLLVVQLLCAATALLMPLSVAFPGVLTMAYIFIRWASREVPVSSVR